MEEQQEQPFKVLREQVKEYVEMRIEQSRLSLIENSAKVVAHFSSALIIIMLIILLLLSLFVAVSFFLGQWMHSYGLGFLTSAGIYFLLLLFYLLIRKKTEVSIMNKIIQLTSHDEQE